MQAHRLLTRRANQLQLAQRTHHWALLILGLLCVGIAQAKEGVTYLSLGYGKYALPNDLGGRGHGFELGIGRTVGQRYAFELGAITQEGSNDPGTAIPGLGAPRQRWRALHFGPRLRLPLAERWELSLGAGIANVRADLEVVRALVTSSGTTTLSRQWLDGDSKFGITASVSLSRAIGDRQRIAIGYRAVRAGTGVSCAAITGVLDCSDGNDETLDGLALSWTYQFE